MEPSSKTDWLINPEQYETVTTPQQIIDKYGKQFEVQHLDNDNPNKPPIAYESSPTGIDPEKEKERFVLTTERVYTLTSDSSNIWRLAFSDPKVIDAVHRAIIVSKVRYTMLDKPITSPVEIPEYGLKLNLNYMPPPVENSRYIMETLDRRKAYY